MGFLTARLLEVVQMGEIIAGILDLPDNFLPEPGQYLPAQHLTDERDNLYRPLFKVISPTSHHYFGPLPSHWQPGDPIACLSPQGNGSRLPDTARRVSLIALDGAPIQILPLIEQVLGQDAAVTLFFQAPLHPNILNIISSSVEISPLSQLKDNMAWSDFFAVEISRVNLNILTDLFGEVAPVCSGQVLVKTAMPCRGVGDCGVCAVKTKQGWQQACTDGPVFPLKELLHVAG